MFTTVGYAAAGVAPAALAAIAAVPDAHVRAVGLDIIVPDLANLVGVLVLNGTGAAAGNPIGAQVQAPSLRELVLKDVCRMHTTVAPFTDAHVDMFPSNPIALKKDELIEAWIALGAAAAGRSQINLFLSDGPLAPIAGKIQTIACATVTAAVANAWTLGVLAPVQALPAGKYQVVGMRALSPANAGVVRLVFVGGMWRPGCPITQLLQVDDQLQFRYGALGVWGEFLHNTPPSIEILSVAAVANPAIFLDIIKVG